MIIWATRMISPIILNHPRVRRMPGCIGISATLAWGQVVLFDFSSAGGTETTTCNIRSDPVAIWTDLFAKYIIYTYIYIDVYIYINKNWLHTTRENVHVYLYINPFSRCVKPSGLEVVSSRVVSRMYAFACFEAPEATEAPNQPNNECRLLYRFNCVRFDDPGLGAF